MRKMRNNRLRRSASLRRTRDLLPKLIAGEIRIREAEKLEEATI